LKAVTSLPIVGEIVRTKDITELKVVVEYDPKSAIAESFRTVRTNLQYMLGDKLKGTIVLTSNNPGEGKTFCSINLGAILARGGKRTIILELDLHKPRVQKGLGIESQVGISTYVIGKNTLEEIIIQSSVENLDVILAGPLPPNPSEIIVTQKMTDLLNYCKENYEFVIVDTPPVGLITDALVLMKHADVTLFVMNTAVAYRHSLNNAHEIVSLNKLGHFGFILNGVKQRRSKYYYNRYNYGYKYGSYGQGYSGGYGGYGSYGSYGNGPSPKK
jgi:tyrosine-protein kinase Etk/Wzc